MYFIWYLTFIHNQLDLYPSSAHELSTVTVHVIICHTDFFLTECRYAE